MKRCSTCKQEKSAEEFQKNTKRPDGLQSVCRPCRADYDRERWSRSPKKRDRAKARKAEFSEWYTSLKDQKPCTDCGVRYPYYVMHFDHLGDKVIHLSDTRYGRWSKEKILAEIAKCELVCANCHAERTYQRRQDVV